MRINKTSSLCILILVMGLVCGYEPAGYAQPAVLPGNPLVMAKGSHVIPFYWQGDTVRATWEPHTAMLIPVKLAGCPHLFYMQFDLGSPYSLFYSNKLRAIQAKYPAAVADSLTGDRLSHLSFTVGNLSLSAVEIPLRQFDTSPVNWGEGHFEIIGTIGVDLIDGKVAVIDYPNGRLTISEDLPDTLAAVVSLHDFTYMGRRVLLPAKVASQEVLLYFDTGSSMYELLTNKATCEQLAAPDAKVIQDKVRSWDKVVIANSYASGGSIGIGGTEIGLHYVTYVEGVNQAQAERMLRMGIGGMTGNKLFLGYRLILDTKNRKFGLMR